MKKALLILLALTTIGGLTYYLSSTGVLGGNMKMLVRQDDNTKTLENITDLSTKPEMNQIDTGTLDLDDDHLTGNQEAKLGTDPTLYDTDGGGVNDGAEVKAGTDPLDATDDTANTELNSRDETDLQAIETTCSALSISPASVVVTSSEEAAASMDFTVGISLAGSLKGTNWTGTLVVKTSGSGTLTDPKGKTGTTLTIPATSNNTSFVINYTGGAGGDVIAAAITEEPTCKDTVTIRVKQSDQGTQDQTEQGTQDQTSTSFVCKTIKITPDTYELSDSQSSMSFKVGATGSMQTSWIQIYKNLMAFSLAPGTNPTLGNVVIETNGTGTLSNNKNSSTGTSMTVPVASVPLSITVNYANPNAEETLKAYWEGQENCSDTLTLTAAEPEPAVEPAPEPAPEPEPAAEPVPGAEPALAPESEAIQESLDSNAEVIIGAASYSCEVPFKDVEENSWYKDTVCRMYEANVINGKSPSSFAPADYLTVAEAVKILDLIAGYTAADATGKTEPFLDVNEGDWFYRYVVVAAEHNVVRTIDSGEFLNPNNPISRGWFTIYAARIFEKELHGYTSDDLFCSDIKMSDPWTYAMILAHDSTVTTPQGEISIFEGYPDGTCKPNDYINRSEAVAIAQRLYLAWYLEQ